MATIAAANNVDWPQLYLWVACAVLCISVQRWMGHVLLALQIVA